jgi:sulfate adenylyltransferase
MRLANGILFPIPITLPVAPTDHVEIGKEIALRSARNDLIAIMKVAQIFEWDRIREAQSVSGTTDGRHPLVAEMASWRRFYVSGHL